MENVTKIDQEVTVVAYYFHNKGMRLRCYPKVMEYNGRRIMQHRLDSRTGIYIVNLHLTRTDATTASYKHHKTPLQGFLSRGKNGIHFLRLSSRGD
jgi:hypothetical protein